ncbi:hypothetical protein CHU92_11665 [Flavobacterium cyanobacteriorum]|uniref:Uncharacterized protein n=1 Tax=Flavobacterium cyanobacteriorum TaxID=2022802 RepID=A0A255YZK4_9FLAO|nr:hypothetical protein CHU92_11665 [Flavobacterium cyanobacteriorum]
MFFLTGDVVAVMGFVLAITSVIAICISLILRIIFKTGLRTYWYFLIGFILTMMLFLLFMTNLEYIL